MQDDEIEIFECPYRNQLERTLEILEIEMMKKKELQAQEAEASLLDKHLRESCIEQRTVIQNLKGQLHSMLAKATKDECIQTEDTQASIQMALDKIAPFKDQYQDLYPSLSKLLVQDVMPREDVEFDDTLTDTIMAEAFDNQQSTTGVYLSDLSSRSNVSDNAPGSPLESKNDSSKNQEESIDQKKKSGFTWGILKKIRGEKDEDVPDLDMKPDPAKDGQSSKKTKLTKEWENLMNDLNKGKSIWPMKSKLDHLIKTTGQIPQKHRSSIWRRLLGNRSRITPRIYKILLQQLPNTNPVVKKCIVLDVNRSFVALAKSQAFERVKEDAVKILQLFEVCNDDRDSQA